MAYQEIERCIRDCEKNAQELRRLAGQSDDGHIKRTLMDSVRHIEMCIQECKFGVEQVKTEKAF